MLDGADVIGTEAGVHVDGGNALVVAGGARAVGGREGRGALLQVPRFVPGEE